MDQRGREAEKRYRNYDKNINYKTISFTLEKNLLEFIENEINKTDDKNMSKFIEENVSNIKIQEMPVRRKKPKSKLVKKTFTFSEEFVKEIKKSGNMSLFVETVLKEKFNLN